jgi:hypothetical protein
MKTVVSVDPCKRIRVAVGTPIKLLIKRMAFPSYEAWQQGVVSLSGDLAERTGQLDDLNKRLGTYTLEVGTMAVVVGDASAFMVRVRLSDGRECDVTAVVDGEQNLT